MTRVDLHLHLLPGIDDGAPDEATALEHAARMASDGVHAATVTPHVGSPYFDVEISEIHDRCADLQRALDRADIALRLEPGGEVYPGAAADLSAVDLDVIAHGPAGARWVLAEVPFAGVDDAFAVGLAEIRARGFGIVIAHPERATGLLTDGGLARLRPALEDGAVLQVNACSLMGRQGPEAQKAARRLVRSRLAYIIASDGHPGTRGHTLAEAESAAIAAGASAAQVVQLTQANPRFLLRHGLPRVDAPLPLRADGLRRARDAARRLRPGVRGCAG
ncbi:MAG TPA: CpsB/CapC family capsule biosynthesis tyrosine phosphatase [Baekduia sp.]|uniref:tyrosine-protein phosphatase n=1 Tax=Baekduia sp. TaxID=2600305 RepID=UPI002D795DE1|nr:CpsB/CapC family capsule biosynthesis tyrosine phosphatase [Baekduia sp.]HET6509357.1 CpsB/CapC family capsule biosynthesis tyrosine phosphatase [Baekduia sp.]